ncbi:MAG: tail fiber domain-containing protein, partial [candidate division Zixibacteria bacterium]
ATSYAATVGGGRWNRARGEFSVVAGGGGYNSPDSNWAPGDYSSVGGGRANGASGQESTVGGGSFNTASALQGTVSGGYAGLANGESATVGGGWHNTASGSVATVAGGQENTASGTYSTVGGGWNNSASTSCSVIPGGCNNLILGDYSIAMGSGARALHNGAFVWADAAIDELESTADNQIMMLGSGGTWIYSNLDLLSGVTIHPGASAWATYSDRNLKENLTAVDGKEILRKISSLSLNKWNFKSQSDNIKHIGPTAQDFYSTFGLGDDDKTISTIDPSGVALAGIQALLDKVEQLEARIAELEAERR